MIHLNKIGLEIEGEWSSSMIKKLELHDAVHEVKHDGSIRSCNDGVHEDMYKREITTKPIEMTRDGMRSIASLFSMLNRAYTTGNFHYNDSCGFHVHTSYIDDNDADVLPDTLASSPFYVSFAKSLKASYPKEYEKRKENRYCMLSADGEDGIAAEADSYACSVLSNGGWSTRYRFINVESWRKYGTLEFRFFPASTPEKMREYLDFIIARVNEWANIETLSVDVSEALPDAKSFEDATEARTLSYNADEGVQKGGAVISGSISAKHRRLSVRRLHAVIAPSLYTVTEHAHV